MLQVFLAEYRLLHRYVPVNAKGFILDVDAAISLGMIEIITLILEDSGFAKHSKTMCKSSRYKELEADG